MPTLAVWLPEREYGQWIRSSEAQGVTGAELAKRVLTEILGSKKLRSTLKVPDL